MALLTLTEVLETRREGAQAYNDGLHHTEVPYAIEDERRAEWLAGWWKRHHINTGRDQ